MSIDDRYRVIGKAAEDYVAVRAELAVLTRKAQELGSRLKEVGEYLCSLSKPSTELQSGHRSLEPHSFEEMRTLLRDLENAKQKRAELR